MDDDYLDMIDKNNYPELKHESDWKNFDDSFSQYIFPYIKRYAKIIDEYSSNPKAEFYQTVWISRIGFIMIQKQLIQTRASNDDKPW